MAKVPISEHALSSSYYPFFERPLAPIDPQKAALLQQTFDRKDALTIHERPKLLEGGYLPGEVGFWDMGDGTLLVANRTLMPGVTGEMLQWWFAWHALDPFRYAIWDNEDHYGLTISDEDRAKILSPDVPLEEKSRDVTHTVLESFEAGEKPSSIELHFKQPCDMGYTVDKSDPNCPAFLICANSCNKIGPLEIGSVMTHMARPTPEGVEFRSRFWMGWNIIKGQPVKKKPPIMKLPIAAAKKLYAHNIKEYSNLAAILPDVYAAEKDNW